MQGKRIFCLFCVLVALCMPLFGCERAREQEPDGKQDDNMKRLCICIGDTYDFYASNFIVDDVAGNTVKQTAANVIEGVSVGKSTVYATDMSTGEEVTVSVECYKDAASLGDGFNVDKGMFKGKKIIVFGDSITDGCLLDPHTPDGFNYNDTYFAGLCRFLEAASDPTDLVNCNFACGATTMTYVPVGPPAISGVERVAANAAFKDNGRLRDPASNIVDADLCVIFYGANDFGYSVPVSAASGSGATDYPTKPQDATTVKGGLYFMLTALRQKNEKLKILVLPPLHRRVSQSNFVLTENKDVRNTDIWATLSDYRDAVRDVSEEFGAKFVDWSGLFTYDNFGKVGLTEYSYDGLHPNVAGHALMLQFLLDRLNESNTLR